MKIKFVTPDKPIFQVWADVVAIGEDYEDCLVIQADNSEQARAIATQCWITEKLVLKPEISVITKIDLITEDIG